MKHADLTGAVDLFGKSYALVRKNLNVYAFVYAVPAAMMIAGVIQIIADNQRYGWDLGNAFSFPFLGPSLGSESSLQTTAGSGSNSSIQTAGIILTIVLLFGSVISYLMGVVLNLRVSEDKKPTLRSLWDEVTQNWLWAKLLGLGVVTIMLLIVGFVLLIVPGVIILWRLFLAPYILIDQKTTIDEALSKSWKMSSGYAWPIYSIILFSFVLALTGIIPILGSLIAFILATAYAAAPALRYQELKK